MCRRGAATRFERHDCGGGPVFHAELAQNMFDVFADRAGLCAENDADVVVALAL